LLPAHFRSELSERRFHAPYPPRLVLLLVVVSLVAHALLVGPALALLAMPEPDPGSYDQAPLAAPAEDPVPTAVSLPTVQSVTPEAGPAAGGTNVTISGTHYGTTPGATVIQQMTNVVCATSTCTATTVP